jgi:gliding motility-associated-like protein
MKKTGFLTILLFIFSAFGYSFNSLYISTIVAEAVVSTDIIPPVITHQPLKNISPITKIARIYAEITDDMKLTEVCVEYGVNTSSISTYTVTLSTTSTKNYILDYFLPQNIFANNPQKIYYRISAFDGFNWGWYPSSGSFVEVSYSQESSEEISSSGGRIVFEDGNPFDGETYIFFPEGALDKGVEIKIVEVSTDVVPINNSKLSLSKYPLKVYKFEPSGIRFNKPVEIGLLYLDLNNDGKVDGTDFDEKKLSVFWYDGINWRNLKSAVDDKKNLVICKTNHFTYFGVFPIGSLTKDDYKPKEKIITPNNDGINDIAHFDSIPDGTEIKIYNLKGKIVRKITQTPYEWNGKDEDGNDLEVGPYIYQFKIGDELISGVIVIAR